MNIESKGVYLVTTDEIRNMIITVKTNKCPGQDGTIYEHLKYAWNRFVEHLVRKANKFIKLEYVPKSYQTGYTIPLYKQNA